MVEKPQIFTQKLLPSSNKRKNLKNENIISIRRNFKFKFCFIFF